ncbi:stemmadenine O-acetyltransferase-like [Impatiens glandulifera]|uniref:stemmadenine O-acetyltransferase-like n=1 Tax=Impatiens glandulifera TaxID=253017 RepID=UPI001FB10068|nr:stemmadenine O-acetyltransferase-like [Impatiens glandulifera]
MALTKAAKEGIWLKGLVIELGLHHDQASVYCDSLSAIFLTKDQVHHERTKHIDVRYHFLRSEKRIKKLLIALEGARPEAEQVTSGHSAVNLRSRMVPPLSEHAIGNLLVLAYAYCSYEDSNDLTVMGRKVREGIQRIDDEYIRPIQGDEGYAVMMKNWMKIEELSTREDANIFRFSSWCRFPVYNVDFGMGKPVWASIGRFNNKNCAILLDSKCGDGIEAWVTMNEQDMALFQLAFVRANTSTST